MYSPIHEPSDGDKMEDGSLREAFKGHFELRIQYDMNQKICRLPVGLTFYHWYFATEGFSNGYNLQSNEIFDL